MNDTKWTLQDLGATRAGYKNWHEYAIRDSKTNVCLAIVGNVDRYFEGDIQRQQAELMAKAPELANALELAQATIERLQRHAPGSANGTLDVIKAVLKGMVAA